MLWVVSRLPLTWPGSAAVLGFPRRGESGAKWSRVSAFPRVPFALTPASRGWLAITLTDSKGWKLRLVMGLSASSAGNISV